jgi:hypothetical protein
METPDDSLESLATIVRRIVGRELREMDRKGGLVPGVYAAISDEDVDRLSKLALAMQRLRVPAAPSKPGEGEPESPAAGVPDDALFRKAKVT